MEDNSEEDPVSSPGLHEDDSISYESVNSVSYGNNEDEVVNEELDNATLDSPTRYLMRESHDFECIQNESIERLSESSQINDSVPEDFHHVESFSGSSFELVEIEESRHVFPVQNSILDEILSSQISVNVAHCIEELGASALQNESSNAFLDFDSLTNDIIDDSRDETILQYSESQNHQTTDETSTASVASSDTQNRAEHNTHFSIGALPVSFSSNDSDNVAIVPSQNAAIQATNSIEEEQITYAFGATVHLDVVDAFDLPMPNLPYPS
ncbi:uncharacterized protein LOC127843070 [Dreissena polymorpha]|uniref:Uncharacterized protein n=1 Tax=Dreissena polymorpha TaxID=45954 RepID=A0A9D4EKP5_DREPO|nr:uncharacterized protein LOC127843070 [Dreissena polymorpha]KAH3782469.1 hypothetical protein DPMN_160383 [Dreissena polymorpha]